jgi:hypothetical protein
MARKITFEDMVFLGVNSREYRNKEGKQTQSFTAKLFDNLTNDNIDYYIRDADKASELQKLPKFSPCKVHLDVTVWNGQAGLMLDRVELLKK